MWRLPLALWGTAPTEQTPPAQVIGADRAEEQRLARRARGKAASAADVAPQAPSTMLNDVVSADALKTLGTPPKKALA